MKDRRIITMKSIVGLVAVVLTGCAGLPHDEADTDTNYDWKAQPIGDCLSRTRLVPDLKSGVWRLDAPVGSRVELVTGGRMFDFQFDDEDKLDSAVWPIGGGVETMINTPQVTQCRLYPLRVQGAS